MYAERSNWTSHATRLDGYLNAVLFNLKQEYIGIIDQGG